MRASNFCARVSSFLVFTTLCAITAFAQSTDLRNDIQTSFKKVDVVRINAGDRKTLTLQTEGRTFELVIAPNNIMSPRYRAEDSNMIGMSPVPAPKVTTYKGKIAGLAASEVRLTIDGEKIEGYFQNSEGRRFIEPARKYSSFAQPGDSVIYRAEDSLKDNTYLCEADIPTRMESAHKLLGEGTTASEMTLRVVELATDADLEWVNALGGPASANGDILGILNMVEGTYNNEVNLSIRVVYQHTWSTADPFGGVDMNGILTSFLTYWNANFTGIARDVAHLFSGKTVVQGRGLAYIGVVCRNPAFSYGVSGYIGWAPGKFLVPAHEIGHNLGANHVDATQNCANSLMNPTLTGTTPLSFCAFSRDAVTAYVSANNSCLSEVSTSTGTARFDFDADGRSDISVFRPSSGDWYLDRSSTGFTAFHFGINGDKPVAADYDGDGKADAAVYRTGIWYRLLSTTNLMDVVGFGLAGDIPSPADFDGDAKADVVVYRPSTGVWYSLASSNGAFASTRFGLAGDIPIRGDYDGDGKDDINLFRPSDGTWYRLNSSNGSFSAAKFGLNGDRPVAADFDGDDKADLAVWRPSNGLWYMIKSANGAFAASAFGLAGDIPTTGDYDGDGKTDIAIFRPSNGVWYRLNSSNGSFSAYAFGLSTDAPIPSYYVQ